jgi:hypothetical protein
MILDDIRHLQLAINKRESLLVKVAVELSKKQARWKKMGFRLTKKGRPDKRYCPHKKKKVVTYMMGNEESMHFDRHGKLDNICVNGGDEEVCKICGKVFWRKK